MIYVYDAEGSPVGFRYRNSTYYSGIFDNYIYGKNVQGDIIYIFNIEGNKVAEFAYDAWGNPVSTNYYNSGSNPGVTYSPFRYRGYWYDEETGLYYLNSRYYNPEWGRFLNADIYLNANGDILGFNMFAYCGNNPVLCYDYSGEGLVSIFAALALLAAAALIPSSSCLSAESSKNKTGAESSTKILYDVPLYDQGNLSLCWAYCEVMVDSYNNSEILNKRIAREKAIQIAQKYHNSTSKEKWNKGGWPSNLGDWTASQN